MRNCKVIFFFLRLWPSRNHHSTTTILTSIDFEWFFFFTSNNTGVSSKIDFADGSPVWIFSIMYAGYLIWDHKNSQSEKEDEWEGQSFNVNEMTANAIGKKYQHKNTNPELPSSLEKKKKTTFENVQMKMRLNRSLSVSGSLQYNKDECLNWMIF